ncbi:hypothetical protein GCM10009122_34850 [Fulvivirga kasyanovii]|uniref:Uncharacterized protein n=1 Tax=Fulvivirga kasyanovii TaxID=396812 RepID=A0ABW9RNK7_9BACT|nr:hypothetical protein [Fulvivirga kasyanovii]
MRKITTLVLTTLLVLAVACESKQKTQDKQDTIVEEPIEKTSISSESPNLETIEQTTAGDSVNVLAEAFVCPPCNCSMHDSIFVEPGVCPQCSMKLIPHDH